MNRCRIIQFAITILLIPNTGVLADIAPDPMTAGKALQEFDGEATEVRMVSEDVLVRVFESEIITVAEFFMYNEGETDTMEVGFPYAYEGEYIEFRAFVNGLEVDTRDGKKEHVGRKKMTVFWKLWEMTFEKGESCSVRVEYRTKTYEMEHALLWTESYMPMPQSEINEAQKLTKHGSVSYLLDTGKAWKGVLDHCSVEFELVGRTEENIMSYGPKDGTFTGSGMIWEYLDYEPKGFISMRYYPNIAVDDIPPFLLGLLKKYPNDPHLASSVSARLSPDFEDRETGLQIYHSFLANWDQQIPQLMEYASGGRCRYHFGGTGGRFYTIWRMAKILFEQYERQGTLEKAADIAPNVSRICSAIADSLDTCGNLPGNNARLYEDSIHLLGQANDLLEKKK